LALKDCIEAGLKPFTNRCYVRQPGSDKAAYAGLRGVAAILSDDWTVFDLRTDVTQAEAWKRMPPGWGMAKRKG